MGEKLHPPAKDVSHGATLPTLLEDSARGQLVGHWVFERDDETTSFAKSCEERYPL